MNENNGKPSDKNDGDQSKPAGEKKTFGSLKPLTAVQIISLIVPSSPVGATACY